MKNLLALGNALVDVLIRLDSEEILTELGIAKGSMQLIDKERFDLIQQSLRSYKKTIRLGGIGRQHHYGAATLGLPAAFIGKIADDSNGAYFEKDMKQAGVETRLLKGQSSSGTAFTFVSPDGERSLPPTWELPPNCGPKIYYPRCLKVIPIYTLRAIFYKITI
jgi:sugar/nucleoside kinase (ribokinase family)